MTDTLDLIKANLFLLKNFITVVFILVHLIHWILWNNIRPYCIAYVGNDYINCTLQHDSSWLCGAAPNLFSTECKTEKHPHLNWKYLWCPPRKEYFLYVILFGENSCMFIKLPGWMEMKWFSTYAIISKTVRIWIEKPLHQPDCLATLWAFQI